MLVTIILSLSIILQLTAAMLALRLIKITSHLIAWVVFASAIVLMTVRRCITLFYLLFGFQARPPDLYAECVALAISILMLTGVIMIGRVFKSIKGSERALRESEEIFRQLSDAAFEGVTIHDGGVIVNANTAFTNAHGYTPDEIAGKSIFNMYVFPESDLRQDIIKTACEKATELLAVRKDGTTFPIRMRCKTVLYQGKPAHVLVEEDITEDKKVQTLQQTSIFYLNSMKSISDALEKTIDIETTMKKVIDIIFWMFNVDRAWLLYPCDPESPSFHILYERAAPEYPGALALKTELSLDPLQAKVMRQGLDSHGPFELGLSEDALAGMADEARKFMPKSALLTTIYPKIGKPWLLGLHQCSYKRKWTDDDKRLFHDIAVKISEAVTNLLLFRNIETSEKKYRQLFEDSLDGIYKTDGDWRFVDVNGAMISMLGYDSRQELETKKLNELFLSQSEWNETLRTAESDEKIDTRLLRKDGSTVWVEINARVLHSEKGVVTGCEAIVRDITRRKLAEDENIRLATAMEQADDAIMITDTEGMIVYVNPAFEKITGYSREETLGANPGILKSGRHDKAFYQSLWGTLKAGKTWKGKITNKKKNGSFYDENVTISPIHNQFNDITNFVAVKHDITDEANFSRFKDYFTAVTSHEMRTPLTKLAAVKMMIDSSPDGHIDNDRMDSIRATLDNSISDFNRIVSATTMFSDLIQSRTKKEFTPTSLRMIITYCVNSSYKLAEKEGRDVQIRLAVNELSPEVKINCDIFTVENAINEILSNAIKYTPDRRNVTVTGKAEDGFGIVEIRDEGVGIPPDKQKLIFEPYFSLENPNMHITGRYKFMGGGIGMGLTLARLVMEYHNGSLDVISEGENSGASIILRFPLADS